MKGKKTQLVGGIPEATGPTIEGAVGYFVSSRGRGREAVGGAIWISGDEGAGNGHGVVSLPKIRFGSGLLYHEGAGVASIPIGSICEGTHDSPERRGEGVK